MTPAKLVIVLFIAIALFSLLLFPVVLRIKGPGDRDPVQKSWQKFLKRLKSSGFEASPADGPIEIAEAASILLPSNSDCIFRVANLYSRSRYSPDPPPVQDLKQAVREFHPNKESA